MNELDILIWIADNLYNPVMDAVSLRVHTFLTNYYMLPAAAVLALYKKTRPIGLAMLCALVFADVIEDVIKNEVQRIRPYKVYDVDPLVKASGYSFPSGHSCRAFAVATVLSLYFKKWAVPLLALASFVAFTRLYLFVHYPTDVIAGAVIGMVCAAVMVYLTKELRKNPKRHTAAGRPA